MIKVKKLSKIILNNIQLIKEKLAGKKTKIIMVNKLEIEQMEIIDKDDFN
jgi:hypothetical protein